MAAGGAELAGGAQIPREKGPRRSPLSGHCREAGLEADSGQQQHLERSWEWPPVIVLLVIVKLFLIPFVILTYNTYDQNKTQSSAPPNPPEPSFLVGRLWAQSCRAVPLGGRGGGGGMEQAPHPAARGPARHLRGGVFAQARAEEARPGGLPSIWTQSQNSKY